VCSSDLSRAAVLKSPPMVSDLSYLLKILLPGDVLIGINDEYVIHETPPNIKTKINKMRKSKRDYKLLFFRPSSS